MKVTLGSRKSIYNETTNLIDGNANEISWEIHWLKLTVCVKCCGPCYNIKSQKRDAKGRFTKMTPDVDGSDLEAGDFIVTKNNVFLVMPSERGDQMHTSYEEKIPVYYKKKLPAKLKIRDITTKSPDQLSKYLSKVGHTLA